MKMEWGRDEITPALERLIANASCEKRHRILATGGSRLANRIKAGMAAEKNYDGAPMRSPSKNPRPDGKFAASYKWRYREGYVLAEKGTKQRIAATTFRIRRQKGAATAKLHGLVRRRVPVTAASKQLQDTGATIKSIDILSADCNRARVGPKTGHGQRIVGYHNETRRPLGISDKFADEFARYVFEELTKGV